MQPVALVTNALEFAGPPAVAALGAAGLTVVAHDCAFADAGARAQYAQAHPAVVALAEQAPEAIVAATRARAGRLDVLVSNDAFPAIHGPIATADVEDLRTTLERLLVFPFALAGAAIPALRERPATARVVMITSNRTRLPMPGGAIPDAARAGLNALVKSLSLELAPDGIPVNAIAPNFLYSETYFPRARFLDDPAGRDWIAQTVPAGRLAEPEEIGELIAFLATQRGRFMTGAILDFSGGWPAAGRRPE